MPTDTNTDSPGNNHADAAETIAAIDEVGDAWAALMGSLGLLARAVEAYSEQPDPGNHAVA